jgi:diketogulonate reductase-like aldo/keto reductase
VRFATRIVNLAGPFRVSRRDAVLALGAAAAGTVLGGRAPGAGPAPLRRSIPSSGERIPAVGLGTWQTFDVGSSPKERAPLEQVLSRFAELGGRVVDTSPMYGRSEGVVGELSAKLGLTEALFLATKVWTRGREAGTGQMETSERLLRKKRLDLIQVHNLLDAGTHLATLRDWKAHGRIRYVGVTHYTASAYGDLARLLRKESLDFVQVNVSPVEAEAEKTILPLARERGVAVLANRPFGGGTALRRLAGTPLPPWAPEAGCASWAQIFLKWILANPAITCVIPATSKVRHLEENMAAGEGALPDEALRSRIVEAIASA